MKDKYLQNNEFKKLPEKNKQRIIKAMQKYTFDWWNSEDIIEKAVYQLFEPILIIPFGIMFKGITQLLDRPVFNTEFGLNLGVEELQEEVLIAYQFYVSNKKQIKKTTSDYKEQKTTTALSHLTLFCIKNNKPLIAISENDTFEDILRKIKEEKENV